METENNNFKGQIDDLKKIVGVDVEINCLVVQCLLHVNSRQALSIMHSARESGQAIEVPNTSRIKFV